LSREEFGDILNRRFSEILDEHNLKYLFDKGEHKLSDSYHNSQTTDKDRTLTKDDTLTQVNEEDEEGIEVNVEKNKPKKRWQTETTTESESSSSSEHSNSLKSNNNTSNIMQKSIEIKQIEAPVGFNQSIDSDTTENDDDDEEDEFKQITSDSIKNLRVLQKNDSNQFSIVKKINNSDDDQSDDDSKKSQKDAVSIISEDELNETAKQIITSTIKPLYDNTTSYVNKPVAHSCQIIPDPTYDGLGKFKFFISLAKA
jgi:hypothetical protein